MLLFDDLRSTLAETLRARVLMVFGRAVDAVEVEIEEDISRGDLRVAPAILPADLDRERLIHGMHFPQLVRSASVESDGTIEFHLDRGSVIVALLDRDGFDSLLLQRIPDDLWRAARAYAGGNITLSELLEYVSASSKRR